ncbi:hypothetical protein KDA_26610 [Dictyobacter alpinus]|uniref:Uncharacterized protein n=1 Tax=Dictyobacter alpinus TaxID=2014873 RepID=A0A402B777_9CHLR|nr:hypothetical protein KDA_26610 [Dictyobacter alpinus]
MTGFCVWYMYLIAVTHVPYTKDAIFHRRKLPETGRTNNTSNTIFKTIYSSKSTCILNETTYVAEACL